LRGLYRAWSRAAGAADPPPPPEATPGGCPVGGSAAPLPRCIPNRRQSHLAVQRVLAYRYWCPDLFPGEMSNFAILNDEEKILRRKEKEAERKKKIQERVKEANEQGTKVGKWADASDEEEEDAKIYKPVSDSESDQDKDSDWEDTKAARDAEASEGKKAEPGKDAAPGEQAKGGSDPSKSKKDRKKQAPKAEDEDLDQVLAEMGIDVGGDGSAQPSASSQRRKKKKEKEAAGEDAAAPGEDKEKLAAEAVEAKPEEEEVDDAKKQEALEALKKKQAAKGKKGPSGGGSDAVKIAQAEAKKRADVKKVKKDKSGYDR